MTAEVVATRGIGRRQYRRALLAVGALATVGCVSRSGRPSGSSTVPGERERALGREAAREVERTTGLVNEPRVADYVREVGARLTRRSAHDGDWTFSVLDDPEPNAFSLPGGYVYVSRGLLALLNTAHELAGVLAHEVAHVVAHHGVRRGTAATPFAVLFGVLAALLGIVSSDLGGRVAGAGELAGGLALSSYSREQELQRFSSAIEGHRPRTSAMSPCGIASATVRNRTCRAWCIDAPATTVGFVCDRLAYPPWRAPCADAASV